MSVCSCRIHSFILLVAFAMYSCCSFTSKMGTMIVLVILYFFAELIVGYMLNSIALVADAFHMLSDLLALIVGVIAHRVGKWPRSNQNTFGWQRAEVVGTQVNTVTLCTLTFTIFIDCVKRYAEPTPVKNPKLLLWVGLGGLLVNVIGLVMLRDGHGHSHGHSHDHSHDNNQGDDHDHVGDHHHDDDHGKDHYLDQGHDNNRGDDHDHVGDHHHGDDHGKDHYLDQGHDNAVGVVAIYDHSNRSKNVTIPKKSPNQRISSTKMNNKAVYLHVMSDFFGSVAVVTSALILWLIPNTTGNPDGDPWKYYVDPTISLIIVILILIPAIPLMKKSTLIILQSVPKDLLVQNLKEKISNIDGITQVHDLHVWLLHSDVIIGTVHIRCSNENFIEISKKVKRLFHDFNIHCTTIQTEFQDNSQNGDDLCELSCDENLGAEEMCKAKQLCCPMKKVGNINVVVDRSMGTDPITITIQRTSF